MRAILIKKRDGSKEEFDAEKIHKILFWATEGIAGVSVSQIEMKSQLQMYAGIKSTDIHEILIAAAHELICEDTPNYQWVAARLRLFQIRKEAIGQYEPIPLLDLVKRNVKLEYYTGELLSWYTEEEWETIDSFIQHDRDYSYAYAGIEQIRGKYLVQNRVSKTVYETPQYMNVLIAATVFNNYPKSTRLHFVKEFYDSLSKMQISLPTPIMSGLRTKVKQFSSCVLIESDDSLQSINATTSSIVNYISQKAGIGIEASKIRAVNSPIRNGDAKHTGVTPFFRLFQAAVKSCSQGGVRGGAAVLNSVFWHLEIENILQLKNNKGTEENSARQLDYCVLFNGFAYERLLSGGDLTLFNPSEVKDLHAAFYSDQAKFKELYEKYEKTPGLMKKTIPARDLFSLFHTERKETGRIYKLNIDHANSHGAFNPEVAPIKMSNLCLEVILPTNPVNDINGGFEKTYIKVPYEKLDDYFVWKALNKECVLRSGLNKYFFDAMGEEGKESIEYVYFNELVEIEKAPEIALCTLAAINMGQIKESIDFKKPTELLVRALNEILDYQDYPVDAAKIATMKRRPLGVGFINIAYWLAKNGFTYSGMEGLSRWHEMTEAFQYYLISASVEVAKEKGMPCAAFSETKYSKGILPIDTYKKTIDSEIGKIDLKLNWERLRQDVLTYGMYNSTLSAGMPSEASSLVSNATNGFEAPRSYVSVKGSGEGRLKQVVPGFPKLKSKYELMWDQKDCRGYLRICAIAQKFFDQTISTNTFYNPDFYGGDVPMSELIKDDIYAYKLGLATLYYCNTYDGQSDEVNDKDDDCAGGACKI